jgi:hypothetical protein
MITTKKNAAKKIKSPKPNGGSTKPSGGSTKSKNNSTRVRIVDGVRQPQGVPQGDTNTPEVRHNLHQTYQNRWGTAQAALEALQEWQREYEKKSDLLEGDKAHGKVLKMAANQATKAAEQARKTAAAHTGMQYSRTDKRYSTFYDLCGSLEEIEFFVEIMTDSNKGGGGDGEALLKWLCTIVAGVFGEIKNLNEESVANNLERQLVQMGEELITIEELKEDGRTKEVSDNHQRFLDNKSVREVDDEKDPIVEFRKTQFETTAYAAMTTLAQAYATLLKGGGIENFGRDHLPMRLTRDQLKTLFQNKTDNYLGLAFLMLCDQNDLPMNDEVDTIGKLKAMSPMLAEFMDVNYPNTNKDDIGKEDMTFAGMVVVALRELDGPAPEANWETLYGSLLSTGPMLAIARARRCHPATLNKQKEKILEFKKATVARNGGAALANAHAVNLKQSLATKREAETISRAAKTEEHTTKLMVHKAADDFPDSEEALRLKVEELQRISDGATKRRIFTREQLKDKLLKVAEERKKHDESVDRFEGAMAMLENHVKSWLVLYLLISIKEILTGKTEIDKWYYLECLKLQGNKAFETQIITVEALVLGFNAQFQKSMEAEEPVHGSGLSPQVDRQDWARYRSQNPARTRAHDEGQVDGLPFPEARNDSVSQRSPNRNDSVRDRSPSVSTRSLLVADPSQNFSRAPLDFFS